MKKFDIGDKVIYDGQLRPRSIHSNKEVGRVVSTVNSCVPYYLIEVLDYNEQVVMVQEYGTLHPLTWLASESDLTLWKGSS